MKVELRNIKSAGGDETPRFEAVLYIDGKKAAHVSNGGTGGPNQYWWFEKSLEQPFRAYALERNPFDPHRFDDVGLRWDDMDDAGKERMRASHPNEIDDVEVFKMLEEHEDRKRLKRVCATKALCHLPGQTYKDGEWSTFKGKLTPELRAALTSKYPGIVFCIDTL